MKPLELLDLRRRTTVGQIVEGMSRCSFGARMLGLAALTLYQWVGRPNKPVVVYDGDPDEPIARLLKRLQGRGWFRWIGTSTDFIIQRFPPNTNVLVVGPMLERYAHAFYELTRNEHVLFINNHEQCRPGQIRDGYFPNVVFADHRLILPIIVAAVREWQGDEACITSVLFRELAKYGGVASVTAHGAVTFRSMVEDPDCTVFLTLSGAMTIAKMGLVICDMVDLRMVHSITSTGALMAHGLVESIGDKHYAYDPSVDDTTLAAYGLNRVTDTLEPEPNLDRVAAMIDEVITTIPDGARLSPREFHARIGEYLAANYPTDRGILKSAFNQRVPVFVPAIWDSEIGNDLLTSNLKRRLSSGVGITIDQEPDSLELMQIMTDAKRAGIFTIGGGVPRNWTQNVAPAIEITLDRVPQMEGTYRMKRFTYGCRLCPDAMHYGHLSGCTYSEGESWRKFYKRGRKSQVRVDATQVWPFYVRHVMDRLGV